MSSRRVVQHGSVGHQSRCWRLVINGQPVELSRRQPRVGLQALGDYPARISPKIHGPNNPNTYDVYRGYDLLMPDGKPAPTPSLGLSLACESLAFAIPSNQQMVSASANPVSLPSLPRVTLRHDFA